MFKNRDIPEEFEPIAVAYHLMEMGFRYNLKWGSAYVFKCYHYHGNLSVEPTFRFELVFYLDNTVKVIGGDVPDLIVPIDDMILELAKRGMGEAVVYARAQKIELFLK